MEQAKKEYALSLIDECRNDKIIEHIIGLLISAKRREGTIVETKHTE